MLRNRVVVAGGLIVVLAMALAILLRQPAPLAIPTVTPGPSTSSASGAPVSPAEPSAGARPSGVPAEVDGLAVLSVSEALARRDAGDPDRLAVSGWAVRFFVPCPQPPDAFVPLESCIYGFSWLMALPEQLSVTNPDGSGSIHAPAGPAFNTTFDPVDAGIPQAVIVIGRFHDPRAGSCPAGPRRDACDRLFVAEGAAWLGPFASGEPLLSSPSSPAGQSSGAS